MPKAMVGSSWNGSVKGFLLQKIKDIRLNTAGRLKPCNRGSDGIWCGHKSFILFAPSIFQTACKQYLGKVKKVGF
ncbi:TPA: hypothetical protein ACU8BE_000777 [Neisseria subflava]